MDKLKLKALIAAAVMLATVAFASPAFALPHALITAWEPTAVCSTCHNNAPTGGNDFVATWAQSMHAQALTDPVYRYKITQADLATGGSVTPLCTTCHGPLATMAGEIVGADLSGVSAQGMQGVACEFCHHAKEATETADAFLGNTSQLIIPQVPPLTPSSAIKYGPFADSVSPAHQTTYSSVLTRSQFCGGCHNVKHPGSGLMLESTYDEWAASAFAAAGIQCQDCHMTAGVGIPAGPGYASPIGPLRPKLYLMTFVGGNAVFGPAAQATARLQSATNINMTVPLTSAYGASVPVKVKINNVGAGHSVPTGITELRQMWLDVTGTDARGVQVLHEVRQFGTIVQDSLGHHPAEMWEAAALYSDDRIPAGGSVESSWTMNVPAGSPIRVRAALYYRSFSPELAAAAGVTSGVPTITMSSAQATITPSVAPTSLTLATSSTRVKIGKQFTLSGLCLPSPAMVGRMMHVDVKKPNKAYWSYSSNRIVYAATGGAASWQYKYTFKTGMLKGVYTFKAVWGGDAYLLPSVSPNTVRVTGY